MHNEKSLSRRLLVLISIAFILMGCTTNIRILDFVQTTSTATLLPKTDLPLLTITNTHRPTNTPVLSTPTPTMHPASTIAVDLGVHFQCLNITTAISSETSIENTIVVQGYKGDPSYIWNIESDYKYVFPEEKNTVLFLDSVSPDGNWLAYTNQDFDSLELSTRKLLSWELVITSVDGHEVYKFPWEEEWFWISGWNHNETLRINTLENDILLNPFTGTKETINHPILNLPNRNDIDKSWSLPFNYEKNLIIYPDFDQNYVIWNYLSNQEIAKASFPFPTDFEPKWSPDDEVFAITNVRPPFTTTSDIPESEIYLVSWEGQVTSVTNFAPYFDHVNIHHSALSWSPNGRYIAFWVEFNAPDIRESNLTLAVLDITTQEVTNYCTQASYKYGVETPIWGPNNYQLLVKALAETEPSQLVLIDIDKGFALQIDGEIRTAFWMAPIH